MVLSSRQKRNKREKTACYSLPAHQDIKNRPLVTEWVSANQGKRDESCGKKKRTVMLFVSDHVGVMGLNGVTPTRLSWDACNDGDVPHGVICPHQASTLANHLLTLTSLTNQQVTWRGIITWFLLLSARPYVLVPISWDWAPFHKVCGFGSPASSDWTGNHRGGKRHAGSIYTTPPESESTSNMKYIYVMIIFLIFTHDSRPKMPPWPFRCMLDVLMFAQGISTIKAAERDQYTGPLLHRDRIKKHHPLHAVRSIRQPWGRNNNKTEKLCCL